MAKTYSLILTTLIAVGCAGNNTDTAGDGAGDGDGNTTPSCMAMVDGYDIAEIADPRVGDVWNIIMNCDNAIMLGAYVLRFTPPETADIDGNDATFRQEGPATMMLQSGNKRVTQDITVQPAR